MSRFICVGEVLWDDMPDGLFLGGAPFNVACHLHQLGQDVVMVSRVGKDELGERILEQMNALGMSTTAIQIDDHHTTGLVNVSFPTPDDPKYDIVKPSAWDFIDPAKLESLGDRNRDVVVFGSLAQRSAVSREAIKSLCKGTAFEVFDINLRSPYDDRRVVKSSLFDARFVKLNEDELANLAKWFYLPPDLRKAVAELGARFGCETICVTRGGDGAALWHRDEWVEHPGYKVDVVSAVGAGDSFLAALLTALNQRKPAPDALSFANAVGAYVATQPSATPQIDMEAVAKLVTGSE